MKRESIPDPELEHLLSGLFDGVLSDEEEQSLSDRLKADSQARIHYLQYSALDSNLRWDYGLAAVEEPASRKKQPLRKGALAFVLPLVAAAVLVFAIFYVAIQIRLPNPLLSVEFADGAVIQGIESMETLEAGMEVPAGTVLIESPSGSAGLRFADGTLITMGGESEVAFALTKEGKKLRVRSGRLTAKVAPQPEGRPLRITTPTAEAEVLGTTLTLHSFENATGLVVEEGLVKLRRLADGNTVEVPAEFAAVATLDSAEALVARPADDPNTRWAIRSQDVTKAAIREGREGPLVYGAVPYIAGRNSDGRKVVRNGVSFNGDLARVIPESEIRLRYRSEIGPTVFLSCRDGKGRFGGNFEYDIHRDEAVVDAAGWASLSIPLSRFRLVDPLKDRDFTLPGSLISKILISVSSESALELETVEVLDTTGD